MMAKWNNSQDLIKKKSVDFMPESSSMMETTGEVFGLVLDFAAGIEILLR